MFIDEAKICLVSGRGGDGIISFRREKYRPKGGPDGGDGGKGGDVILRANPRMRTLLPFTKKIHWKAEKGGHGGPNRKRGRKGKDLIVDVPVGTVVKDLRTGEVLADLSRPWQRVVIVRGGEGGRGNWHFRSPTRKAPRIREKGAPGEERWVKLELKLLADVGIVGLPNTGKSTLLSKITAKRPKVAPYPFTTLEPNLGVVEISDWESFVVVDIPGLIEGAHEGRGLGDNFLKHVERCRLLIHLIDVSGMEGHDPIEAYRVVNEEMKAFSPQLAAKPQIVVGNKIDLLSPEEVERVCERFQKEAGVLEMLFISAATGQGVRELIQKTWQKLQKLEAQRPALPEAEGEEKPQPTVRVYRPQGLEEDFVVERENSLFRVRGPAVERLTRLDLSEQDAVEYLQEQLKKLSVFRELKRHGIQPGDRVVIGTQEFEYQP
jgi:GTP-binding protein